MESPDDAPSSEQLHAEFVAEMARYTQQLRQYDILQRQIHYAGAAIGRQLADGVSATEPAPELSSVRLASWRHRMV